MELKKGYMKNILRLPFLMSIIAGLAISCGSGSSTDAGKGERPNYSIFSNLVQFDYINGLPYADLMSEEDLVKEYNTWHSTYVVDGGNGTLRVQRDISSDYDTVSEGIAYGMLIAVYFNDQVTFDKLYGYVKKHLVRANNDSIDNPLAPLPVMHWKVSKTGVNISEFRIKVPHGPAWMLREDWNKEEEKRRYIAAASPDGVATLGETDEPNWFELARIKNNITPQQAQDNPALVTQAMQDAVKALYIKACRYDRRLGSATDADMDIAMALVIASKKWQNNVTDYREEAAKNIKCVLTVGQFKGDLQSSKGFISNGTSWGGQSCWNPSYFMPAWLRGFKDFINSNKNFTKIAAIFGNNPAKYATVCDTVLKTMYGEMDKINAANGKSGLFPDWCDTSDAAIVKKPVGGSDRVYFLDINPKDGYPDVISETARGAKDSSDKMKGVTYEDGLDMQSTNFFYDAVRVPWRIATDYAWYGSKESKPFLEELSQWFKGRYNKDTRDGSLIDDSNKIDNCLYDGYSFDGGNWDPANRDGFNNEVAAKYYSTAFVAMCAPVSLFMADNADNAKAWMQKVIEQKDLPQNSDKTGANQYTYYGNTLRLLSLLFMSGKFTNPETTVAIKSVEFDMYATREYEGHDYPMYMANPHTGSATIGDNQKFVLISLGGDKVAIRSYTYGGYLRPDMLNHGGGLTKTLVDTPDPYESGDVVDNFDILPSTIFTIVDLNDGSSAHTAFLHQVTKCYIWDSYVSTSMSSWGYNPMGIKRKNEGAFDNTGKIRPQLAFDIEVLKPTL